MPVVAPSQMTLNFEPGILERYSCLLDCVRQSAYTNRNPLKTIAADMDLSQSELSRKLADNPNDPRQFSVVDLERYINATRDVTPVLYLAAKYLTNEEEKQKAAMQRIAQLLPVLQELVRVAS
jgi:hypothetical protein